MKMIEIDLDGYARDAVRQLLPEAREMKRNGRSDLIRFHGHVAEEFLKGAPRWYNIRAAAKEINKYDPDCKIKFYSKKKDLREWKI